MTVNEFYRRADFSGGFDREIDLWKIIDIHEIPKVMLEQCLPDKKDLWGFNESITEYQEFSFTTFNELLFFVKEKWGITEIDFKPKNETSII